MSFFSKVLRLKMTIVFFNGENTNQACIKKNGSYALMEEWGVQFWAKHTFFSLLQKISKSLFECDFGPLQPISDLAVLLLCAPNKDQTIKKHLRCISFILCITTIPPYPNAYIAHFGAGNVVSLNKTTSSMSIGSANLNKRHETVNPVN